MIDTSNSTSCIITDLALPRYQHVSGVVGNRFFAYGGTTCAFAITLLHYASGIVSYRMINV